MKAKLPAKVYIIAIIAVSCAAAWALAIRPIQLEYEKSISAQIRRLLTSALQPYDVEISYANISPALLGHMKIRGISLVSRGNLLVSVPSIDVGYDLFALLKTRSVESITSISASGLDLAFDFQRDRYLYDLVMAALSKPNAKQAVPKIKFAIKKSIVRLKLPEGTLLEFKANSVKAVIDERKILFDAKAEISAYPVTPVLGIQTVRVPLSAAGSVGTDLSSAEIDLRFTAVTPDLTLKDWTWNVILNKDAITASLAQKSGLPAVSLEWDAHLRRMQASVVMDRFKPSSMVSVSESYKKIAPWLSSRYSGNVEVNTDFTLAGTIFSANLNTLLPIEFPGGALDASAVASGSLQQVSVQRIRVRNSAFDARLAGTAYPGKLGFEGLLAMDYSLGSADKISATMEVFASEGSVFAYAKETLVADSLVRDLTASVNFKASELFFLIDASLPVKTAAAGESGILATDDAVPETDRTKLSIEGSVWLGKNPYFSASVSFESLVLAGFSSALESAFNPALAGVLEDFVFSGNLSLYGDFKDFSYSVSNAVVTYTASKNAFAVLTVQGNGQKIEVSNIDAHIAGYAIGGSASMVFESKDVRSLQVAVTVNSIPYAISASLTQDDIFISGDYGLRINLNSGIAGISGSISVENLPVPFGASVLFVSTDSFLNYVSFDNWNLLLESLSVVPSGADALSLTRMDLAGELHQNGAYLNPVRFQGISSALTGNIDVTWSLVSGLRVALSSVLNGLNGETYLASGEYANGGIYASFSARKASLERWNIKYLKGIANVDAYFSGPLAEPRITASFVVNEGRELPNVPYFEGEGSYEGGLVKLNGLKVFFEGLNVNNASLEYQVAGADLSCRGDFNYDFQSVTGISKVAGRFSAQGKAPGVLPRKPDAANDAVSVFSANPIGSFSDYVFDGSVASFSIQGKSYSDWPFNLALGRGSVNLVCGPKREFVLATTPAGDFSANLAPTLPLSGDLAGILKNGIISLKTDNIRIDLPFLFTFLSLPIVKADSGIAKGNIQISGPLFDPSMNGNVEFENFYLKIEDFVPDLIGPVTSPLTIDGKEAELSQPAVACGDGTVSIQLFLSLSGWLPQAIRVNTKGSDNSLVHVKSKLLGLKIDGYSIPNLTIVVDDNGPNVSGNLTFSKGDIEITTEVLSLGGGEFVIPGEGALSADMQLLFGKNVNVKFQPYKLPLFSGQADPSSQLRVQYNGNTGDYSIKGKTVVRGGSVFYIQKNFFLKTATVVFDEDSSSFNPLVTLRAETRTANAKGPVLIILSASNMPLNVLKFKLESIPSYSEVEIAQLLGQDLVSTNKGGTFDPGKALIENSDLIPQLDVVSLFKTNLQSLLGLDFFYMKTLVVQRWLYDLSGLGASDTAMTLSDYLDNTAIVAGKYLTDDLFLQVMLRLQESPLAQTGNLRLDSEISLEWNGPHFLLNWQIRPDLYNYFIPEQSLSVSWRLALP